MNGDEFVYYHYCLTMMGDEDTLDHDMDNCSYCQSRLQVEGSLRDEEGRVPGEGDCLPEKLHPGLTGIDLMNAVIGVFDRSA